MEHRITLKQLIAYRKKNMARIRKGRRAMRAAHGDLEMALQILKQDRCRPLAATLFPGLAKE